MEQKRESLDILATGLWNMEIQYSDVLKLVIPQTWPCFVCPFDFIFICSLRLCLNFIKNIL